MALQATWNNLCDDKPGTIYCRVTYLGKDQFGVRKGRDTRYAVASLVYCVNVTLNTTINSKSATLTTKKPFDRVDYKPDY